LTFSFSNDLHLLSNDTTDVTTSLHGNVISNGVKVPEGCLLAPKLGYVPWNNPQNLISKQAEEAFDFFKAAFVVNACFLIRRVTFFDLFDLDLKFCFNYYSYLCILIH
jgi:hypothetical protein